MSVSEMRIFENTASEIEALRDEADSDGVAPELFFAALLTVVAAEAVRLDLTPAGFRHLSETAFLTVRQMS